MNRPQNLEFYRFCIQIWGKLTLYNTEWESDQKTQEESQEVSPFPTDDHKAAINRHHSLAKTNTNNIKDPQRKHRLGTSVRKLLEGLK